MAQLHPHPKPSIQPSTKQVVVDASAKRREHDKKRADEMAREALGLKPGQPSPLPQLSPELDDALDGLDQEDRPMVETVLGCTQEMTRRVELARKAVQEEAGAADTASKRVSFSQQLMVRRADDGTMTQSDIERARGIIENQGARGRIDPMTSGANALFQQSQDMLTANSYLVQHLMRGQTTENKHDSGFVIRAVEAGAGTLADAVRDHQASLQSSDLMRLRQVVTARDNVRREGASMGIGPT